MNEIYLLSGLGADKRVFDFIDLSGFKINHVEWIDPRDNESIESYSKRLLKQIKTARPILIGVSFGGMISIEIAKLIETEKVIIISSAATKFDIPVYLRIAGQLGLNKLIPTRLLKTVNSFTFWFFGATTKKEKDLLRTIISETDNKFLKWAANKIPNWGNTTRLQNLIHIHGTADKILPLKAPDFRIPGGGHLMIISHGQELSKLIKEFL
jgi:pimeloyl-ACP methyl ester carboxylesterase